MKLVVLGGGESGVGTAILGKKKGYDVFVSDFGKIKDNYKEVLNHNAIAWEEETHTESLILDADVVMKSPGIPEKAPIVKKLIEKGIKVISEIEFTAPFTKAITIGITGSNGKTTTTLLTYHILKSAGLKVGLAGNVGDSFAKQVIEDTFDYFVLELSSFQLDNCYNFKADIAILLNITPDHLDRYEYNFQNYVNSKFRILQNMTATDHFIYFQESEALAKELTQKTYSVNHLPVSIQEEVAQGAFVQNGILEAKFQERDFQIEIEKLPIKGTHNSINASCAVLASQAIGLSDEQITTGILSFQSVEHRLEPAGIVNGVS